MSDAVPVLDLAAEASAVSVQAVPGAVFLRLKHECADGPARRMFVELTIGEAVALRRELDAVIGVAAASA
jgi:hypothetical protein